MSLVSTVVCGVLGDWRDALSLGAASCAALYLVGTQFDFLFMFRCAICYLFGHNGLLPHIWLRES